MRSVKLPILVALVTMMMAVLSLEAYSQGYRQNYYLQQQQMRQQQMQQQQRQQEMARQQQEQMRRQQEQQRQEALRQQERQRQMQEQMRQRQLAAQQQRQQALERQRQQTLERQRVAQQDRNSRQTQQRQNLDRQQQQRLVQQQQALRQQRITQERQIRLRRLADERSRKLQDRRKDQQNVAGLAGFAAKATGGQLLAQRVSPAANRDANATMQRFKVARQQQQRSERITKTLELRKQTAQIKARQVAQARVKLAGLKKEPAEQPKATTSTQKLAQRNFGCRNGVCGVNSCSFRGDTLVLTKNGLSPIASLAPGKDMIWAKHEVTGDTAWKPLVALYSSMYPETVEITIRDATTGGESTVYSNRIHPFFVDNQTPPMLLSKISGGLDQLPELVGVGGWVQAQDLRPWDKLTGADDNDAIVVDSRIYARTLRAYNLTVADFHTYFVKGSANDNVPAVWVHNDCNDDEKQEFLPGNKHDQEVAVNLGYDKRIPPHKAPFASHGKPVYTDGKNYITRDRDGHRGGYWKMMNRNGDRIGTYNIDMTEKIGD